MSVEDIRRYWDDRARENAVYYVDTSLAADSPDMARFWETGRRVVDEALINAPAQPAERGRAVEIGSGLGRICVALADHFDEVVGVDVSAEMVERARALVDHPRVRLEVGDGISLSMLPDDSADLVISFTVFQHQTRAETVVGYLTEAGRVLRPGGVVAVQWNNAAHRWRYALWAWSLRARRWLGRLDDQRAAGPFLGKPFPVRLVRDAVVVAGLQPVATRGEGTLFCWMWAVKPPTKCELA